MLNNLLSSSKKIKLVASFTFVELYKSKIFYSTALVGLGTLLVTFIAYSFTYGTPYRVALDFGLGTLSLSSVGIAVFLGIQLISKEIENRTVYMIISRPISRPVFIAGKVIGLIGILFVNIVILSVITLSLYFIVGGAWDNLIPWCILFTCLESFLVLLIVILFSLLSNNVISVLGILSVYIIGHSFSNIFELSSVQNSELLRSILKISSYVLPGFYQLNLKPYILYNNQVSNVTLVMTTIYSVLYSGILILFSLRIFNRKSLD